MNKSALAANIAEKANLEKKQAEAALRALVETLTEALRAGDKVQIPGFGTFELRERAARTGHKPGTGEPIEIAAKKYPFFKAGKDFKDAF